MKKIMIIVLSIGLYVVGCVFAYRKGKSRAIANNQYFNKKYTHSSPSPNFSIRDHEIVRNLSVFSWVAYLAFAIASPLQEDEEKNRKEFTEYE